ncbi:MAG: Hpt domain-containing protein [Woeseiaceae bacterium]
MENVTGKKGKQIEIADPFARRLIGKYLDNRKEDIGKLQQALVDSDFETIKVTGHNLYGSGAAYGLDDISFIGAGIEIAAEAKDGPRIECLIGEMKDFLRKLKVF